MARTDSVPGIREPTDATLRKYGLSREDWWDLFWTQEGACGACRAPFREGKAINIDHHHRRRWKSLRPEVRKQYVRGLTCWQCNRFRLFRGARASILYDIARYLEHFEERLRNSGLPL